MAGKGGTLVQLFPKRWRLWAAGLFCLGALDAVLLLFTGVFDRRHYPTDREFGRVAEDMTPAQVEAILGPPHKILTADSEGLTADESNQASDIVTFAIKIGEDGKVHATTYGSRSRIRYYYYYFQEVKRWLLQALGI